MVLAGKVRHGYGLVLDCIDSWFLPSSLLRRIKDQDPVVRSSIIF